MVDRVFKQMRSWKAIGAEAYMCIGRGCREEMARAPDRVQAESCRTGVVSDVS